jgi:phage terminase Nu1 subunit (DNA packaging protein)
MSYFYSDSDDYENDKAQKTSSTNTILIVVLIAVGILLLLALFAASSMASQISNSISKIQQAVTASMQKVWLEHVGWTREVINTIADGAPLADQAAATARLLQNVPDMIKIFSQFYPANVTAGLADLLNAHLTIAAELVTAAKKGDMVAAADAEKRWYANATDLATYLHKMNPNWNQTELQNMLNQHLALTKQEAVQRISGDYLGGIQTYQQIENQAIEMANMFVSGLVKQFPNKF